ncbi:hypothetical protein QE375_001687 [Microbacterium foliorum]|uniref:DUF3626 domain-containing protein n=1 Tax=Microbacterium foliorum TaxID=104336 RepID=A0ABU1HR72_9MICO|nr:DUF3626 domain-containing protein [Microbacterium foliorum]MDR6142133.1 hypothetical protein [Microbacterium foliorum]
MPVAVLLHFHPDWPFRDGTVMDAMARDGRYRSQFETGTSNGGLTAHRQGDRWRWESRLFDGRYDAGAPHARPVYGALDLGDAHGASPRFGSSFVRLRPEAAARATFCYPDSVFEPDGVVDLHGVDALVEQMRSGDLDPLDRYVEAHVHGGVDFAVDVEEIVLDPCFRDSDAHAAAARLAAVDFHPGFRADTAALDPRYRGAEYVELARSLSDELTPDVVGAAARSGIHEPQALKRVWHLLARFGRSPSPAPH